MLYTRFYIIQLFGILLLVLGYLVSDPADSLSLMHIDPNPACPSVFGEASHTPAARYTENVNINLQGNSNRKSNVRHTVSFEIILAGAFSLEFRPAQPVMHSQPLPGGYQYLYSREINPPPPKGC